MTDLTLCIFSVENVKCIPKLAEQSIQKGSKSFYFASLLFNKKTRTEVAMLYSWCRYCDDQIDDAPKGEAKKRAEELFTLTKSARNYVKKLKNERPLAFSPEAKIENLTDLPTGSLIDSPLEGMPMPFVAAALIAEKFEIPEIYFEDLLIGMEYDADFKNLQNMEELQIYCYRVAGVVGIMMTYIMGSSQMEKALPHAKALGEAMQITNICRDIFTDNEMGRCYLPESLLNEFGLTQKNYLDVRNRNSLFKIAEHLITLADQKYFFALKGIRYLNKRSAFVIVLAALVYKKIGDILLKHSELLKRATTSYLQKIGCLAKATWYWLLNRILA